MLVFLSLAAIGLLFLLISAFAGDHIEVHPEVEVGGMGSSAVRAVAVFLTAFGTVGAIARWYGMGNLACSLWGLLSGVLLSIVYVLMMGLVQLPGGRLAGPRRRPGRVHRPHHRGDHRRERSAR